MPGYFDNKTRVFVAEDSLQKGDWYTDGDGTLWIVPRPADGGEIASDYDGDLLDRVNVLCREVGPFRNPTAQEMEGLGFSPVGESAKRFSPEDGYYTA